MRRQTNGQTSALRSAQPYALDHLTVIETTPRALAETAARSGFERICTFVRSIEGLGGPQFDLTADRAERAATLSTLGSLGLSVDVAYPFTISDRTQPGDFEGDLACAAELGARFVNLLIFARDPSRIRDETARFAERAQAYGLKVAVEMVPASSIKTLAQASALVRSADTAGSMGINLDALHLYRSGSSPAEAAPFVAEISYLQICDGPLETPLENRRVEASLQRQLPGQGAFDLRALTALLPGVPASLEIPDLAAMECGQGPAERARAALAAAMERHN